MKIFFLRLFFILAIVFIEFSFFGVISPQAFTPFVLIASVVAWVLVSGFPAALFMTVPLAAFFDIVSSGMPGSLTLYSVPLAYATSFLSRRILVEHRGTGMVLYALYSGFGAIGYAFFDFIFFHNGSFVGMKSSLFNFLAIFSIYKIFLLLILALPIFICLYQIIRYFEGYISSLTQRDFSRIK
jgi:hypothetical protein